MERNPARETARKIWLDSGKTAKLRDIAKELNVSEKTVSTWKHKDDWEGAAQNAVPKRKRGGQPGNKNAKGAPPGNQHGLVTGAFETIFFDSLDDEERRLIAVAHRDKRIILQHQIDTLMVRERRMLRRIADLRSGGELVARTRTLSPMDGKTAREEQEARDDRILRIESALTGVQAELRRCVDSMRQLDEVYGRYVSEVEDLTPLAALLNA